MITDIFKLFALAFLILLCFCNLFKVISMTYALSEFDFHLRLPNMMLKDMKLVPCGAFVQIENKFSPSDTLTERWETDIIGFC